MNRPVTTFIRNLVSEEVRRIVADAVEDDVLLSAPETAAEVLRIYPNCGLAEEAIADEVMMAAAKAGVAVEIGNSRSKPMSASGVQSDVVQRDRKVARTLAGS